MRGRATGRHRKRSARLPCSVPPPAKRSYWTDYETAWNHALTQLVDHEHGGWFKVPALKQDRTDTRKGDSFDPDYHPCGACLEAIRSIGLVKPSLEVE